MDLLFSVHDIDVDNVCQTYWEMVRAIQKKWE